MEKLIVIINGSGGAGKDQFVKFCSEFKHVMNVSSIDNVKYAMEILCPTYKNGLEKQHNEIGELWRSNLHDLKTISIKMDDGPYKIITGKINEFLDNKTDEVLFLHIRETEEIVRITKCFDCKTVLITNSNVEKITSNPADANVENFNYDIIIDNSRTLLELEQKAKEFISLYTGSDD
jgi:dephospho-CoA kinase